MNAITNRVAPLLVALAAMAGGLSAAAPAADQAPADRQETKAQRDARMAWWRQAKFGMFIHWGLYAVPAGEWNGKPVPGIGEWIMNRAQIQVKDYEPLVKLFNPVKFDANQWVKIAKDAGMKYMVITSKHHDGFCLWPSDQTDYDIASTPFKRDILGELTAACKKQGVRMCFYHSIMDWHHPDYLPRRAWEKDTRPAGEADYERYVGYMKSQLKELVQRYDPGVLWFDGEWEATWTHEHGKMLYQYMRQLKPDIIINNRVDKGRGGMKGISTGSDSRGDFGTPEQQIPATGLPGVDWESCMTMNNTWGYKKDDQKFKSAQTLIRNLVDTASKGGNYLLNVGPQADGLIPQASVERLAAVGRWMKANGESIHGTQASPVGKPDWGRITCRIDGGGASLYLHVFDWPKDGKLPVAVGNEALACRILADARRTFKVSRGPAGGLTVELTGEPSDPDCTTLELKVKGRPEPAKRP